MFFALRTSPLVLAAMLVLLLRGRWLGLPWNLSDTVLTAYLLEALVGDVTTLLALRREGWGGRWRVSLASLALELFPSGVSGLVPRMRRLAETQLSVPLVASGLTTLWFLAGQRQWWSHSGMAAGTSLFVLVTTLLPAIPRIAAAGSACDRLFAPRWAQANWLWAATVRALDSGAVLRELVTTESLTGLLPGSGRPLEPISLLFQTLCCELGDFEAVRPMLKRWQNERAVLPVWLAVDGLKQSAAVFALVDGDLTQATACLEQVTTLQLVPWYASLVCACLAHATGDAATRDAELRTWHAAVEANPRRALLLSANRWILTRLEPAGPTPR